MAKEKQDTWYYDVEANENSPPYLMVAEEFKVKFDFMTKLHTRDGHLLSGRDASKRGRAKWYTERYEQVYYGQNEPSMHDPRLEVYVHALGLSHTREPRAI